MTDSTWNDGTVLTLPEHPPAPGAVASPPVISPPPTPPAAPGGGATPTSRPGWRLAAAFLAGTIVSAGSFGLGALWADSDSGGTTTPVTEVVAPSTPEAESATPAQPTPTPAPAEADAQSIAVVASALSPSVVQVETNRGLGSGVIYDDGLVITNHHVIDGASQVRIRTSDGRAFDAELVGSDSRNDIAVLDLGRGTGLPAAPLALDSELAVGEQTIAIGSPFQLQQTVTAGIVSALNRPVPNNSGGMTAMIQTDAPINPGNSGGALANAAGEIIGINTSIRTDGTSNSNVGIGFAVPIETAFDVAQRITAGQGLDAGVLGVQASATPDDEVGVVLGEITPGGAADEAGLASGDRILSLDGAPVTQFADLVGLVQSNFAGDTVEFVVIKAGAPASETTIIQATLD